MSALLALLPWLGLAAAFSPVLADLVRYAAAEPSVRYALVFLPLLAVVIAAEPRSAGSARGWPWLIAGLGIELVALRVDAVRYGRPGLVLGVIGLCQLLGVGSWRSAALALWTVPVPFRVIWELSPHLERSLLALVAPLSRLLGAQTWITQSALRAGSEVLVLRGFDCGASLVALLSGLAWYASLRQGLGREASLRRALHWGLAALPLQGLGFSLAGALLAHASAQAARSFLDVAPWLPLALGVIAWTELRRPRGGALPHPLSPFVETKPLTRNAGPDDA